MKYRQSPDYICDTFAEAGQQESETPMIFVVVTYQINLKTYTCVKAFESMYCVDSYRNRLVKKKSCNRGIAILHFAMTLEPFALPSYARRLGKITLANLSTVPEIISQLYPEADNRKERPFVSHALIINMIKY